MPRFYRRLLGEFWLWVWQWLQSIIRQNSICFVFLVALANMLRLLSNLQQKTHRLARNKEQRNQLIKWLGEKKRKRNRRVKASAVPFLLPFSASYAYGEKRTHENNFHGDPSSVFFLFILAVCSTSCFQSWSEKSGSKQTNKRGVDCSLRGKGASNHQWGYRWQHRRGYYIITWEMPKAGCTLLEYFIGRKRSETSAFRL